jgi:hypothetical protein
LLIIQKSKNPKIKKKKSSLFFRHLGISRSSSKVRRFVKPSEAISALTETPSGRSRRAGSAAKSCRAQGQWRRRAVRTALWTMRFLGSDDFYGDFIGFYGDSMVILGDFMVI